MHKQTLTQHAIAVYAPATSQRDVLAKREQGHHLVTVRVDMPHLKKYGRSSVATLAYGATFAVKPGDIRVYAYLPHDIPREDPENGSMCDEVDLMEANDFEGYTFGEIATVIEAGIEADS